MKKLSPPSSMDPEIRNTTGITIDEKIQLEDSFAPMVDELNRFIIKSYPTGIFYYKPNSSDTKGLSVIVEMSNEWKTNYKWCVDNVKTKTKLTYNMEKNLLSLTQPTTSTTSTPSTDTTKTTTAAPTDTSSSFEVPLSAAYGGGVGAIVDAGTKAIAEQVKRMKSLMKL